jgi:hypothetical protein
MWHYHRTALGSRLRLLCWLRLRRWLTTVKGQTDATLALVYSWYCSGLYSGSSPTKRPISTCIMNLIIQLNLTWPYIKEIWFSDGRWLCLDRSPTLFYCFQVFETGASCISEHVHAEFVPPYLVFVFSYWTRAVPKLVQGETRIYFKTTRVDEGWIVLRTTQGPHTESSKTQVSITFNICNRWSQLRPCLSRYSLTCSTASENTKSAIDQ